MSLTIRPATQLDVPALVALMIEFYAESGFSLPSGSAARAFTELFVSPHLGAVWLAEQDGQAVGHIVLTAAFSMEYGGLRGFIDDLFVRAAARGQGCGMALLAAARAEAIARDLRALCVEAGGDGHRARALYARAGYVDSDHALLVQPLAAPVHEA
jgi:GNAT superfamily N-acetyltransferase